ncbi:hypothetical protein ACIBQ0_16895 [Nocardia nova]|uniref:hypothetical protein n=1 Tax=Nocardia nova TaxID=37330 RepID=UPI0037B691E6
MTSIVRTAGRRSFYVLILSGYLMCVGWALYLPGVIDADRFVAGLRFALAVFGGGMAGVWLYAAADVAVRLLGGSPTAEGGSSPVDAAGGLLALPGTSGEVQR